MVRLSVLGAVALVALSPPHSPRNRPEPRQGQAGKDVIWMPTPESLVERMLTMAQVTPRDVVYDLGSGDGHMVIAAAKRGAQAVRHRVQPRARGVLADQGPRAGRGAAGRALSQGDIFEAHVSDATVVTLYLLSSLEHAGCAP